MTIQNYLAKRLETDKYSEIAADIGVSISMVSAYVNKSFNPSLKVAIKVYLLSDIVLLPFSEEGLKREIT